VAELLAASPPQSPSRLLLQLLPHLPQLLSPHMQPLQQQLLLLHPVPPQAAKLLLEQHKPCLATEKALAAATVQGATCWLVAVPRMRRVTAAWQLAGSWRAGAGAT
jgi:hypothetical protein